MPTISSTMYVIAVQDLRRSAAFYENTLGFSVREMGDSGWSMLVKDNCRIMAGHCPDSPAAKDQGDHSYFAYLVDDYFDQVRGKIEQNGGKILKAPQSESWGMREFAIETLDGHCIMIAQELQD